MFYDGAVFQLRNSRRDRYDAVDFAIRRTFAGQFEWFLGYTRSSTRTNAAVEYSLENPVFAPQMPGPFAWDTPNRVHMWGWAPLPKRALPRSAWSSSCGTPRRRTWWSTVPAFRSASWIRKASWWAARTRSAIRITST